MDFLKLLFLQLIEYIHLNLINIKRIYHAMHDIFFLALLVIRSLFIITKPNR